MTLAQRLFRNVSHLRGIRIFRNANIHAPSSTVFLGVPIVDVHEGSTVELGERVVLCSDSRFTALGVSKPVILRTLRSGAVIDIGSDVGMSGTVICAALHVSIGARCLIGADVTIADTNFHPVDGVVSERRRAKMPTPLENDAIRIGSDVFIGAGALILPGVTIGDGAVIGARSVVTTSVPPNTIAAGVPAKVIRTLRT